MGFLDKLFGKKVTNPVVDSAIEAYAKITTDDTLVDLWQKFSKAKILVGAPRDTKSSFGRIKQIKDAVTLSFTTCQNERGENTLAIFTDSEAAERYQPGLETVTMTGDDALTVAAGKGLNGLTLNPKSEISCELRTWQYTVFIEKVSDANKLHAIASKFSRSSLYADAEGVLKAAVAAAQRDPGPQHPFTGELNLELARALRTQGKLNEAEWVYRRALSIYEVAGSHDLDVAGTCEALGSLYIENKKLQQATPMLTRALGIYESVPGSKPDAIGKLLCQLAEVKLDESNLDEAEQYYTRASVSLEERKHPDWLTVLNKMGALCEAQSRNKEALAHYMRTLSAFETIKRARELDTAVAAHRIAAINLAEGHLSEVQPYIERATDFYSREANNVVLSTLEALTSELKTRREAEEAERDTADSKKSRFGAPAKRPSDLPLADFSSMKNNPKATVGPGTKPVTSKNEKTKDPEEEALDRMRAFLDNVDKDVPEPAKKDELEFGDSSVGFGRTVSPKDKETIDAIKESVRAEEFRAEDLPETVQSSILQPLMNLDLPETVESAPAMVADAHPIADAADLLSKEKPALDTGDLFPEEKAPLDTSDLFSSESSEPKSDDAPPAVSEDVATDTKAAQKDAVQVGFDTGGLFEKPVDADISSVFNRSIIGEQKKDERFDKPVAARLGTGGAGSTVPEPAGEKPDDDWTTAQTALSTSTESPAEQPPISETTAIASNQHTKDEPAAEKASEPAVGSSAEDKKGLFDPAVEAEISGIFNKSVMGSIPKDDRFDKPISERMKAESRAAESETEPAAAGAQKTQESADSGLFSDADLDDALSGAFASILAEPRTKTDFDKPVAEKLNTASAEPSDEVAVDDLFSSLTGAKPVTPKVEAAEEVFTLPAEPARASAKETSQDKNPLFDPSLCDIPIGERMKAAAAAQSTPPANDTSRFDIPIAERNQPKVEESPPADGGLFGGAELDDALSGAFASLMAEPQHKTDFDKPIAERLKSAAGDDRFEKPVSERLKETAPPPVSSEQTAEATPAQALSSEAAPVASAATNTISKADEQDLATAKTPEELIKLLEQKLQSSPDNTELLLRKGTALVQQQRLDEAIKVFDKVTRLTPNDTKAWYCKGSSLHLKSQFEDALYCFNHVLNLEKENSKAQLRKAECLQKLGRADQAMALYDRLLLTQPKFVAGWLSKARALLQQRKLSEALEAYEQALLVDPNNEEATKAKNLIATKLGAATH